ncbi:MAG: hypothetical protein IPK67_19710 [Planctomycetes bacterium]|nr:hypothetical protein [Planctomycetota bacterium]
MLIVLAILDDPEALIVCTSYKDESTSSGAHRPQARRNRRSSSRRRPESAAMMSVSEKLGVRPVLGVRAKLASRGAGHWEDSTGDRAKFGLTIEEMVDAVERLRAAELLDCLQMLHFHIGSQVSAIRSIRRRCARAPASSSSSTAQARR